MGSRIRAWIIKDSSSKWISLGWIRSLYAKILFSLYANTWTLSSMAGQINLDENHYGMRSRVAIGGRWIRCWTTTENRSHEAREFRWGVTELICGDKVRMQKLLSPLVWVVTPSPILSGLITSYICKHSNTHTHNIIVIIVT